MGSPGFFKQGHQAPKNPHGEHHPNPKLATQCAVNHLQPPAGKHRPVKDHRPHHRTHQQGGGGAFGQQHQGDAHRHGQQAQASILFHALLSYSLFFAITVFFIISGLRAQGNRPRNLLSTILRRSCSKKQSKRKGARSSSASRPPSAYFLFMRTFFRPKA